MSQETAPRAGVTRRDEIEISLAEVLAPLRRRWRLVLLGTAACWVAILVALVLTPPTYRCEGALAVPDAFPLPEAGGVLLEDRGPVVRDPLRWEPSRERRKVGIPVVLYKKVVATLSDGAVVEPAFAGKLPAKAVERLRQRITEHVSPMTSVGKDDVERLEKDSTVAGIFLSYESRSADRSRDAVHTLAWLVREALVNHVAADQVEWDTLVSEETAVSLGRGRAVLSSEHRSLERLTEDLERLARTAPESAPSGREIVDIRDGGHVFLSPRLQLVGARARLAENEHSTRMYDEALARHTLRLRFLSHLRDRAPGGGTFVPDLPRVADGELRDFLSEEGATSPAARYVQADVEALREKLVGLQARMSFVQTPTTWARSRTPWAAALASMALLVFIAAAFVADLWRRSGEGQAAGGPASSGGA